MRRKRDVALVWNYNVLNSKFNICANNPFELKAQVNPELFSPLSWLGIMSWRGDILNMVKTHSSEFGFGSTHLVFKLSVCKVQPIRKKVGLKEAVNKSKLF